MAFIFGGDTGMSYEDIQRKRQVADSLMGNALRPARNVGEGLAAIGAALAVRGIEKRTKAADEENRRASKDRWGSIFGGGSPEVMTQAAYSQPAGYLSSTPAAEPYTPPDPNSPQGIASDAMAAIGKSVFEPGNRESFINAMMPHALRVSKMTGLDPRLVIAQAAQETGWGKSAPNNNFFGVKSHGKGGGANLGTFEFVNGQPVNVNDSFRTYSGMGESAEDYARFLMENPRYREMLAAPDLQGQLSALGASGYATDPNYAASVGSIAGSINIPGLPAAGQPQPGGQHQQGGGQPIRTAQAGNFDLATLAELAGDPYASPGQKAVLQALITQQTAAMDPMRALEMERARLELDQLRNPQVKPININGKLVDPNTYEVIADFSEGPEPTSAMQEYEFARSQGYEGTFADYKRDMAAAGRSSTTVTVGGNAVEPLGTEGQILVPDPTQPGGYRVEIAPGSKLDQERIAAEEAAAKNETLKSAGTDLVMDEIAIAKELIAGESAFSPATGITGKAASLIDSTRGGRLKNRLATIKANIGFDKLQAMREASPTGGALGGVSEFENRLLQAVYGSLEQAQSAEDLIYNLERLETIYNRIVNEGIPEDEAREMYRQLTLGDEKTGGDVPTFNPETGMWE